MKIATWNVFSGTSAARGAELTYMDIIAFQETSQTENTNSCVWAGDNNSQIKGVSILSPSYSFSVTPPMPQCSPGLAARFDDTPLGTIQILNLWAKPKPDYFDDLINSLGAYENFISKVPTIILGDFNISPKLSGKKRKFEKLVSVFEDSLGMSSAYHHYFGETYGEESRPTLYHLWKEDRPFHIDFVFLPRELIARLKTVAVPDYLSHATSDHRPVICEFE